MNERQQRAVLEAIDRAQTLGARAIAGGEAADGVGYFVRPTLLEGVRDDDPIAREEVFGPVSCLLRFDTLDEALARANAVEYGLSAAIFTRAIATARRFTAAAQAGVIHVNSATTGADVHVPFGGVEGSGWGPHEQGRAAQEFFTDVVTVYQDG